MDFQAIDKTKLEEYTQRAKAQWGGTAQYAQAAEKEERRSPEESQQIAEGLMQIFAEFGALRGQPADAEAVQGWVQHLKDYITAHYYDCTDAILSGLGKMYAAGGEFTENIDRAGGDGTAEFAAQAIAVYCK